jgi:FkbM family methyltransferase
MENDIYESGQVRKFFPYVRPCVQQFILGGPADGDEAQLFHEVFPNVLVTGFEPHREFYKYQQRVYFPGSLRPEALWNKVGEHPFYALKGNGSQSSRMGQGLPDTWVDHDPGCSYMVPTITLDTVFHPAIERSLALWIDIERSELQALQGAEFLLTTGAFDVILVEAFDDMLAGIVNYLEPFGMKVVATIIPGRTVANYVFWKV